MSTMPVTNPNTPVSSKLWISSPSFYQWISGIATSFGTGNRLVQVPVTQCSNHPMQQSTSAAINQCSSQPVQQSNQCSNQPVQQSTRLTRSCSREFTETRLANKCAHTVIIRPSLKSCFLLSGPTRMKSISTYILQYKLAKFYSSFCCVNLLSLSLTL